jgi:hypothetical protein
MSRRDSRRLEGRPHAVTASIPRFRGDRLFETPAGGGLLRMRLRQRGLPVVLR